MTGVIFDEGVVDTAVSKDRVLINVGGIRHECYISTIQNFPDTRLYWIAETALKMADFDPEGNEFFFDRHPQCFANILNYCRTGKLHCPNDVCGPLFEQTTMSTFLFYAKELAFWGVDELMMEPCCWGSYTQHRNAHKNLTMFDEMRINQIGEDEDNEEEEIRALHTEEGPKVGRGLWSRWLRLRPKLWSILEKPFSSVYSQVSAFISMMVILISLATFCAETIDFFKGQRSLFHHLEYFYCAFFTMELLLRLLCCPSMKKYLMSMMTWIDIISTLQFYISFIANTEKFDFLFVSRLLRIFRLFRFFKNLSGMQVIAQTLKASANELLLLCIIVLIPMIIFSTLVFYAEEPSPSFDSIPGTFWWTIVTMTTVGYGDVTPRSLTGKIIGAFCACSGVLIVALPVSVIGSNFNLYYSYAQARMNLPKRKSPALVSADKALVTSKKNVFEGDASTDTSLVDEGHTVGKGLRGLTNVMIDLTTMQGRQQSCSPASVRDPSTRRCALQIEPIGNMALTSKLEKLKKRQLQSQKSTTGKTKDVIHEHDDANGEQGDVTHEGDGFTNNSYEKIFSESRNEIQRNTIERPTSDYSKDKMSNRCQPERTESPFLKKDSIDSESSSIIADDDSKDKLKLFEMIPFRQRSTSAPYKKQSQVGLNRNVLGCSAPVSPVHTPRRRTVIHVDLMKYQPKKISRTEVKERKRKLTFSLTHNPLQQASNTNNELFFKNNEPSSNNSYKNSEIPPASTLLLASQSAEKQPLWMRKAQSNSKNPSPSAEPLLITDG